MGTTSIKRVTAVRDAVDRLEWQVAVATDFFGTETNQAFVLHWEGRVGFYREVVAPNAGRGSQSGKLALVARWLNREVVARIHLPREMLFDFATDLPGGALDRIEALRDGGRLFACLEGHVFLVLRDGVHFAQTSPRPWIDDALALAGDHHRTPCATVCSEPKELTRDIWCTEVLATLRPPGRFILEALLPVGTPHEENGSRAVSHLCAAQRALDEGRYDEVARLVHMAGEALQHLGPLVEARYGELAQKSIAKQNAALLAICHPERHDASKVSGGHDTDRVMAQHLVASMQSVAAVYFAGPRKT